MKYLQFIVILALLSYCLSSCEDFTEKDISSSSIQLICPTDSFSTYISSNLFWWDSIEGVSNYQFQIVSPTFNSPIKLILDTCISSNKCMINLTPGVYEWRVRGINSAYNTPFSTRSLIVDSSLDLSVDRIILKGPIENDTFKSGTYRFSWDKIYKAERYRFILLKENDSIIDTVDANNFYNLFLDYEGTYIWMVKAMNDLTETPYSTRNFYLDTTRPAKRTLLLPQNNSIIYDTIINCQWNYTTSSSSEFDSIYISSEISGSTVYKSKSKTNSVSCKLPPGKYNWKVKGFDRAGNVGPFSNIWNFELVNK